MFLSVELTWICRMYGMCHKISTWLCIVLFCCGCRVLSVFVLLALGNQSYDCPGASEVTRADSRFAPSQWKTALLCNDVSNWLGASLESALVMLNNMEVIEWRQTTTKCYKTRTGCVIHWIYWNEHCCCTCLPGHILNSFVHWRCSSNIRNVRLKLIWQMVNIYAWFNARKT